MDGRREFVVSIPAEDWTGVRDAEDIARTVIHGTGLTGQTVWARNADEPDGWVKPMIYEDTQEAQDRAVAFLDELDREGMEKDWARARDASAALPTSRVGGLLQTVTGRRWPR